MLSTLFDISVPTVKEEIHTFIPVFRETYRQHVRWPSLEEWTNFQGRCQTVHVGAIGRMLTEMYRSGIEPQKQYFSGNGHYHCIHTQVVITNDSTICYVESSLLGQQNDAHQFMIIKQIGIDLLFPDDLYLHGDQIYPIRHPIMTPYTNVAK